MCVFVYTQVTLPEALKPTDPCEAECCLTSGKGVKNDRRPFFSQRKKRSNFVFISKVGRVTENGAERSRRFTETKSD